MAPKKVRVIRVALNGGYLQDGADTQADNG
jgi:hypothetical protein